MDGARGVGGAERQRARSGGGARSGRGGESGRKLLKCSGARKPLLVGQSRSDGLRVDIGIFGKCTCTRRTRFRAI